MNIRQAGRAIRTACRKAEAAGIEVTSDNWGIMNGPENIIICNPFKRVCPLGALVLGQSFIRNSVKEALDIAADMLGIPYDAVTRFVAGVDGDTDLGPWTALGRRITKEQLTKNGDGGNDMIQKRHDGVLDSDWFNSPGEACCRCGARRRWIFKSSWQTEPWELDGHRQPLCPPDPDPNGKEDFGF